MGPPVIATGTADSSASGFPASGGGSPVPFFCLLFGAIPSGMSKISSSFVAISSTLFRDSRLIFRFRIS